MTHPYAPRGVLRHLSVSLLRQFFQKEQVPLAVAWGDLRDSDAESLYEPWQALPLEHRDKVEEMLRSVHDLATPHGIRLLFDETAFQHGSVPATFESIHGLFGKALWMLLHQAPIFHEILRIVRADQLSGRYWRTTTGLPGVSLTYPQQTARELAIGLQQYLPTRQGRGQRVTVEHYFRAGRDHYFFCYPDDYTQTHASHGPDGKLKRSPHRPVFEVVYVYTPDAGTLDLYAPVDKAVRAEIEEVFCRTVLNCDPPPPRKKSDPRFELNALLRTGIELPTDPADGIKSVMVRRVRFALPTPGERMVFEIDATLTVAAVRDRLRRLLNPLDVVVDRLNFTFATFVLTYTPPGEPRDRKLTFDVGYPDTCSLKNLPEEQRLLGEKYLRRWGIARD